MEPIIFDQSPLAEYLKGEGGEFLHAAADWPADTADPTHTHAACVADAAPPSSPEGASSAISSASESDTSRRRYSAIVSASSSHAPSRRSSLSPRPVSFAPTGRPTVRSRFRGNTTNSSLRLDIPAADDLHAAGGTAGSKGSNRRSLQALKRKCSAAVASTITSGDNARFLEQFRYTIVASQLLSGHAIPGQPSMPLSNTVMGSLAGRLRETKVSAPTTEGLAKWLSGSWAVTVLMYWVIRTERSWRKNLAMLTFVAACGVLGVVCFRQRLLQRQKDLALDEISRFVTQSHELDSVANAALALVQEVELVSRGYRLSTPLPPISRIEDRSQARKCIRLRRALKTCYADLLTTYNRAATVVKDFSEPQDLEKYCDIYDLSDYDVAEALAGNAELGLEDQESLRTLKILAARFAALRKLFLCALLALDAIGDGKDLLPWTTAAEAIKSLNSATKIAYGRISAILREEESFPVPPSTPKAPLTPGKERWRAQLRKLGSLSSGIRGLQAKMHILREESDRVLEESSEVADIGPSLLIQYESIGVDLKELVRAWEEGKAALASGIDRNEKRLSSMSTAFSPTTSWSGLTTVEEGGTDEAFRALTGESPQSSENESEEVYEAVALPRPRSTLTRDQRIVKMREEREQREVAREAAEASRGMMRELESVIRPRMMGTSAAKRMSRVIST